MSKLLTGILVVAVVATVGDYVWFEIGIRHRASVGAMHGALLLGTVGAVLGWLAGRILAGLLAGIAAGVGGALAYYALSSISGQAYDYPAMVAAWAAVWMVLAVCDGRVLRRPATRSWSDIAGRGALAAIFGGLAFYSVVGVIWGRPPAGGRNYALQLGAWIAAWAPGMLAIGLSRAK